MTSWLSRRRAVYTRDRGVCQVCLVRVGRVWDAGHLVERIVGGKDHLNNLVLMCQRCNRTIKPIHSTREEALAWLREQQERARTGREAGEGWRPFHDAMFGRSQKEGPMQHAVGEVRG